MGAFDQADPSAVPASVRDFDRARRRWVGCGLESEAGRRAVWDEFAEASRTFQAILAARGGTWTVGGLTYGDGGKMGIWIEATVTTDEAAAAAD